MYEIKEHSAKMDVINVRRWLLYTVATFGILSPVLLYLLMKKWNEHVEADFEANSIIIDKLREVMQRKNIIYGDYFNKLEKLNEEMMCYVRRPELITLLTISLFYVPLSYMLYVMLRNIVLHSRLLNDFQKRINLALRSMNLGEIQIGTGEELQSPYGYLVLGVILMLALPLILAVFGITRILSGILYSGIVLKSITDIVLIPNVILSISYIILGLIIALGYLVLWMRTCIIMFNKHLISERSWRLKLEEYLK